MRYLTATTAVLLLFSVSLQAQYQSERKFDTFQKISVTDGIKARIFNSNEHKVILRVSDMPETRVKTELSAYELTIRLETGLYEKGQVYAEIYLKDLKQLEIKNSSDVSSGEKLKGDALVLRNTTSSKVDLDIEYNYVEIESTTSSELTLKGTAKVVNANAATSSSIKSYDLETETYKAKATTSGEIFISSENVIEAVATTSGTVYYKGKPARLKEKSSMAGKVVNAN
jgi:hypothetical protein